MNWKLIFKLSLLVCFISSLIFMIFSLYTIRIDTNPPNILNWLFYIILIFGTIMPPILIIARKVRYDRFLHGFLVGGVSGIIGIPFFMLIIGVLVAVTKDPGGAYAGLLAVFIPFVGIISGCVIGLFSEFIGNKYDPDAFDKKAWDRIDQTRSEDKHENEPI